MTTLSHPVRIYVAGPMTGIPRFNFPAFDGAAIHLRNLGYDVVSPAELDSPEDRAAAMASPDGSALDYGKGVKKTWGEFLARDVKLIADGGIEAVAVLPGWNKSRGARLETFVANALHGLPVYAYYRSYGNFPLERVPEVQLFRAWCDDPSISIYHSWHEVYR